MHNEIDLNAEFNDYGNQLEVLQGIQINDSLLNKLENFKKNQAVFKISGVKFESQYLLMKYKKEEIC